jgi:uncharacterized protein YbaA (DUF1428 family)
MTYVDGFVAAVPTANREIYKKHAEAAACRLQRARCIETRRVLGGRCARGHGMINGNVNMVFG